MLAVTSKEVVAIIGDAQIAVEVVIVVPAVVAGGRRTPEGRPKQPIRIVVVLDDCSSKKIYECSGSRHTDSFAGGVRAPNRQAGVRCPLSSSEPHSQCETCASALRTRTTASGKTEFLQRVELRPSTIEPLAFRLNGR